ncbi:MAG: hypothetical protein IPO22_02125 [Anaerolineales bacterium]|nr:hypothetical protein [Anaerolineales bacterium]
MKVWWSVKMRADRIFQIGVCKKKRLTNMRASGGDLEIRLTPPPAPLAV